MDRIEAASEASLHRGIHTAEFTSYHYVSPSSYLSLCDAFDAKRTIRDGCKLSSGFSDPLNRDGPSLKEAHTEPLIRDGYGGYTYSSSYDDMRKNVQEGRFPYSKHFEDRKPYEVSAYGRYGREGFSFHDSRSNDTFYKSLPSPHTSGMYGDDGPMFRHHSLSYQGATGIYQSQHDYAGCDIASLNNSYVTSYEPSAAFRESYANLQLHDLTYLFKDNKTNYQRLYHTPQDGISGASTEYQQSSGLLRMYDSNYSRMLPPFGALGEWRNTRGKVHDGDVNGQQSGSLLSNVGNGLGFSVYPDLRVLNKYGMRDGEIVKQAAQPETGHKGNITSLCLESGSKFINYDEGVMQMQSIDTGREATGKKRQSRWEPVEEDEKDAQNGSEKKKKKTRWSEEKPSEKEVNLADILKGADGDVIALRAQLMLINRRLQSGKVVDDIPMGEKSPSPEPVFDNLGYQVNTREFRARERLTKERQRIIVKLAEKGPTFTPSSDFKPSTFSKKPC